MSDWDADDFEPAPVTDKIAALGLDTAPAANKVPESSGGGSESGAGRKPATGGAGGKTSQPADLTEAQKRAMQLRSDRDIALDLFGMTSEKEKTFDGLQTQEEFRQYASALGEQIAARHTDDFYLFFVNTLVEEICAPMSKLQLETVRDTVQKHLRVHEKKEETGKPEGKAQTKTAKKATKKKLYEDAIVDEYDDYAAVEDKFF